MKRMIRLIGIAALAAAGVSCGDVVRQGRSSSYLVVDSLAGIRGGPNAGSPASTLISDVITNVTAPLPCSTAAPCPTIFGDPGQASLHLAMKDPGTAANPNAPGPVNAITINRYHVQYTRADGRNTAGLDVPYPIDGAATATISSASSVTIGFELVRVTAKEESPLVQLTSSNQFVTMLATVTFYGHDQAGNDVSVAGMIEIQAGNFGDF
jgi:hypothetical protein